MGDARNKERKLLQGEADHRKLAAMATSYSPREGATPTIYCADCGMDGRDQSKPDGTFIRFIFVPTDPAWATGKIYCEHCLNRTGGQRNATT